MATEELGIVGIQNYLVLTGKYHFIVPERLEGSIKVTMVLIVSSACPHFQRRQLSTFDRVTSGTKTLRSGQQDELKHASKMHQTIFSRVDG